MFPAVRLEQRDNVPCFLEVPHVAHEFFARPSGDRRRPSDQIGVVLRMDPLEAGSLMTATALVLMVVSPSAEPRGQRPLLRLL